MKVLAQTLTPKEIGEAWIFIVKNEQKELLQSSESGKFERLGAFKNEKGLVMAGRRVNGVVPLLPKSSKLVKLAIKEEHQPCHLGVLATASKVRTKLLSPNLLRIIKSVLKFCAGCRLYNKERASQLMGFATGATKSIVAVY